MWVSLVLVYFILGWFVDLIFSLMMYWDDDELVGMIFYELVY